MALPVDEIRAALDCLRETAASAAQGGPPAPATTDPLIDVLNLALHRGLKYETRGHQEVAIGQTYLALGRAVRQEAGRG